VTDPPPFLPVIGCALAFLGACGRCQCCVREAFEYLRRWVSCRCKSVRLKHLYTDMFSSHVDYPVVGAWRAEHQVSLECSPPYMHWKNSMVEQRNEVLKRGVRVLASQLVGKTINGRQVTRENCMEFWNLAHHRCIQMLWNRPNSGLERRLGYPATPHQVLFRTTEPSLSLATKSPMATGVWPFQCGVTAP